MQADREKTLRMIKTARGQLDGIIKMVEEDRYCMEISNQLLAAQSILRKVNREIIHAHLQHCVRQSLESEDSQAAQQKIEELMTLFDKLSSRRPNGRPLYQLSGKIARQPAAGSVQEPRLRAVAV